MKHLRVVVALCFLAASSFAMAADKGFLGFSISVKLEGMFSPTVESAVVSDIAPGSPADVAGLVKGDQFVEVAGHVVAGAKALELKPYLSPNAGETVHFKVKKASGELVAIALTASKKP